MTPGAIDKIEALIEEAMGGKDHLRLLKNNVKMDKNPKRNAQYQNEIDNHQRTQKLESVRGWRQERDNSRKLADNATDPTTKDFHNFSANNSDNKARTTHNETPHNYSITRKSWDKFQPPRSAKSNKLPH